MSPFGFAPLILVFPILGLLVNLAFGYKLDERWVGIFACGAVNAACSRIPDISQ